MLERINNIMNMIIDFCIKWYERLCTENFFIYGLMTTFTIFFSSYLIYGPRVFELFTVNYQFADPASAFAESLIRLYNYIWMYLIFVSFIVIYFLIRIIYLFAWKSKPVILIRNFINFLLKKILKMRYLFVARQKTFRSFTVLNELNADQVKLNIWYSNDKRFYDLNWRREMKRREKFLKISDIHDYKRLDYAWCAIPTAILLSIMNPSLAFIHTIDPAIDPIYTIKITGKQWYWNYNFEGYIENIDVNDKNKYKLTEEYRNFYDYLEKSNNPIYYNTINDEFLSFINRIPYMKKSILINFDYDSIMLSENELIKGTHRLLEVDNRIVVPIGVPIRFVITSNDVIHSWSIPALGLKVDAVPGRLNQFVTEINKPGIYFGQCSELCGSLHGFMPIVIHAVSPSEFENSLISIGKVSDYK